MILFDLCCFLLNCFPMKNLFLVGRAIGMLECGRSIRFVSQRLGVSRSTVKKWKIEFEETGTVRRRKSTGRPSATCGCNLA